MGALALRPADLREFDGEARVQDLRLAEVLGYDRGRKIREIIRRYGDELLTHGVLPQVGAKLPGRGRGRPEHCFMLNEAQAILVSMFSRTERAAEARRQIVDVFLGWRHGKLVSAQPAQPVHDPLADTVARLELLERLVAAHPVLNDARLPKALAHLPERKWNHYPAFWSDLQVRELAITTHRQMSVREAREAMMEKLGRCPSKSALHRFWQWLDVRTGRTAGRAN